MTKKLQLYKCNICNNHVEVMIEGKGELVCCGENMELIECQTTDDKTLYDKHIPVIEKTIDGHIIRVGAMKHPMTQEHHIIFIQAISHNGKYVKTKFLELDDNPELNLKCNCPDLWARALCNIHGLFKGEQHD